LQSLQAYIIQGGINLNKKLERFKRGIKNKKVAVIGMGISNTPLIRYLTELGVDVTAFDKADKSKLEDVLYKLKGLDIKYSLGESYLSKLTGFDIIFKTPGMRYDVPELVRAREEGAEVTSEMEVFFDLCPAEIIAVTGSDGKTTTTTIIYNILKTSGYNCWLGGNIGMPLLSSIDEIESSDKVVLELSSFQLHTMTASPHIAVITNIAPNHLDMHKSMDEYVDAKKNIFKFQTDKDLLVLNHENDISRKCASEAKGKVLFFSRLKEVDEGAFLRGNKVIFRKDGKETEIMDTHDILLPGVHNHENYLAATAAVMEYATPAPILEVASKFSGVEHRMELVREHKGVRYFNDSIGSSPTRTMAGLKSFDKKVILIAGGKDKNLDYTELGELIVEKVKCLVLIGQTATKIEQAVLQAVGNTGKGREMPVIKCETLHEAVHMAASKAEESDIVILSPASSSFDMFKNFEERGNIFKKVVNELQ